MPAEMPIIYKHTLQPTLGAVWTESFLSYGLPKSKGITLQGQFFPSFYSIRAVELGWRRDSILRKISVL